MTYFTLARLVTTDLYFPVHSALMHLTMYWSGGEGKTTDLFFFECSSFPLFTPKILVMRVLKRRVEEFLTWDTHTKQRYGEKKGEQIEKKSMYAWVSVFDTPTELTQHPVEKFVTLIRFDMFCKDSLQRAKKHWKTSLLCRHQRKPSFIELQQLSLSWDIISMSNMCYRHIVFVVTACSSNCWHPLIIHLSSLSANVKLIYESISSK